MGSAASVDTPPSGDITDGSLREEILKREAGCNNLASLYKVRAAQRG